MFEKTEKFLLIDENEVTLTEPLEIREPSSFGDLILKLLRDPEDRGGANFEFGDEESILGFDRWDDVYTTIQTIIAANGSDSNIRIEYYHLISGTFEKIYEGHIIPSSMDEVDDEVRFRVKRTDFGDKFRTRIDVENDIESEVDLDGNVIPEFDLKEIALHSVKILRNVLAQASDVSPAVEGINTATDSEALGVLSSEADLLCGFTEIAKQSVKDYFDYGTICIFNLSSEFSDPTNNSPFISKQYIINCQEKGRYDFDISIDGDVTFVTNLGGALKDFGIFWWFIIERPSGNTVTVLLSDTGSNTVDPFTRNFAFTHTDSVDLEVGDNVYLYGYAASDVSIGGTSTTTLLINDAFISIDGLTTSNPSLCQGEFIYETLNRLINKAVGGTGIGEITLTISSIIGSFNNGNTIKGQTSKATGIQYSQSIGGIRVLVDVKGSFVTGETIESIETGGTATLDIIDGGDILSSSLLEKPEQGAENDGCGALNFVTSGFAIRNFINEEYDNSKYYKLGERVTYLGIDYEYINSSVAKGNLPTNATYWKVQDSLFLKSSIKRLLDFVKIRYGAGIAIIREEGSGFGGLASEKIRRVLVEKHETFFQDKKIISLTGVENPVTRKINKEILFNEIEAGYSVYSKNNEDDTLGGYNTFRKYLNPVDKDKKKFNLVSGIGTDGYEIERLKRESIQQETQKSDEKDNDTFIVKCIRVNNENPIDPGLYGDDPDVLALYFEAATDTIEIRGLIFNTIVVGDKLKSLFGVTNTWVIASIYLDFENNKTIFTTSTTIVGTGLSYNEFYFTDSSNDPKDVFVPERREGFSDIDNIDDANSQYNIDHAPTNILIENFGWFGGGLVTKNGAKEIKFTSGKNNVFFEKSYDSLDCSLTTNVIAENQNFLLSSLRSYAEELFSDMIYEVDINLSYDDFEKLREAMIGESDLDINFGYVDFVDNENVLRKAFPFMIKYNPATLKGSLLGWEKHIPFIPDILQNLEWWFDNSESDLFTLTGALVDSQADKAGNGYTRSTSGAERPTLSGNEITYGGSQLLSLNQLGTMLAFQQGEFFLVAKSNSTGGNLIFYLTGSEAATLEILEMAVAESQPARNNSIAILAGTPSNDVYGDDSLEDDLDYHILNWRSNGSGYGLSIDGIEQNINGDPDNGDWFGDNTNLDTFTFSALKLNGSTFYDNITDKEVMYFNEALSEGNRAIVIEYLKDKHGL